MDANKMDGVEVMAIINGEVEESMKITEDELALLDQLFDFDHYKFDPDLHVHIKVLPHPFFTRDGADIHCEVPIQYPQAALGAQIEVPTLDGKVTMRVPPGTQSGKSFRLRGKGLEAFGGVGKGDQFVTLVIEVPQQVTDKQRELLEALAAEMNTAIQLPRTHGFLNKLRLLFE